MTPVGPHTASPSTIYCRRCGYDLRASLERARCPECGRMFSPDDPQTFRVRPFPAPWKRALVCWARRTAVLLLTLLIILAATWLWLYWGWKQEQVALRALPPGSGLAFESLIGKSPHKWSEVPPPPRWSGPPGFVLIRLTAFLHTGGSAGGATDTELASLDDLPWLDWLELNQARITDKTLRRMRNLHRLKWLELSRTGITDAGLEDLAGLTRLEHLKLSGTGVRGPGLAHLASLKFLRELDLTGLPLTDADLAALGPLPLLESLKLNDTALTDASVPYLASLHRLRELFLAGTKISFPATMRLRAAHPDCNVVGAPPPEEDAAPETPAPPHQPLVPHSRAPAPLDRPASIAHDPPA